MARDAGYDDPKLASLGLNGTKLTGVGDDVPAQPAQHCNAVVDANFIMQESKFTRPINMALRQTDALELD